VRYLALGWPSLLALALFLVAFATYGYRARPHNPVNRWFALQTLTLALWIIGIAGAHAGYHPEFWGRWTFASACLMPPAFFGFTSVFPENSRPNPVRLLPFVVAVALVFAVLSAFTPLIAHSFVISPNGVHRQAGPLMPLFSLYFLISTPLVLGLLITKWLRATGQARAQLRFYNTGLLALCIGAITTNLILPTLTGNSNYSRVGPYFVLPLVGLIGHAIIRHRLFDLRIIIHRGGAFLLFIGLTSASIVLILKQIGLEEALDSLQFPVEALVVAVVAAASLSSPIAPYLSRLMDTYFLRGRPDLDRALQEAARRLSRLLTASDIALEIEAILKATLAIDFVTVLTDRFDPRGLPEATNEAAWAIATPPPTVLLLAREQDGSSRPGHIDTLRDAGVEVWVALGRGTQKTGVILLGARNGGEAYFGSTLRFIEDIAELSSMAFEVAFLHRKQIELERDRDRLEHFARMGRAYAGLGHEIRTPLTTISNLIALIPDRLEDAEFRDVLTRLIPGEVARIVKLTERLRLMVPADSAQFGPANIHRILTDIVTFQLAAGVRIRLDTPAELPMVHGDGAQLIQLFTNLVNNAIEAMPLGGEVVVRIYTSENRERRPVLVVEVIDQGAGVPKEISDKIFEPFFTTKPTGTGLGLPICREIADFHGAILTISPSREGSGTIAAVEFPVASAEAQTASLLTSSGAVFTNNRSNFS
jgi:signal transduction histidine kinase